LKSWDPDEKQVLFHQLDIADPKSVDDLRDYISKEFGGWVLDYGFGRCFYALNTTSPELDCFTVISTFF